MPINQRFLHSRTFTSSIVFASYLLCTSASFAFNPNADTQNQTTAAAASSLPDPEALYNAPMNRYASIRSTSKVDYIPPVSAIEMPKPLYPERVNSVAPAVALAPVPAPAPAVAQASIALPPVSEEVKTAAEKVMAEQQPVQPAPMTVTVPVVSAANNVQTPVNVSGGFIAPAPLAVTPPARAVTPAAPRAVVVAPVQAAVIVPVQASSPIPLISKAPDAALEKAAQQAAVLSQQPNRQLSDQTRSILSHVPGNLDKAEPTRTAKVSIDRVTPEINDLLGDKVKEDSYEAAGLSIKVRRNGLDTNYELNRAYTSLMGGDSEAAIETYKNILSTNATNQDALFGLAATYHRLGNFDKARPLYGALLKINPQHREALNNFLVLASDESPQDALPELVRLETRNPDFSPIPAQIAIVLDKLGFKDEARDKMLRAIELAPDNMTYKYNLAIMLDRQGQVADASALYRMLIESSLHGQKIPASVDAMQRRLNYLSASPNTVATATVAAAVN